MAIPQKQTKPAAKVPAATKEEPQIVKSAIDWGAENITGFEQVRPEDLGVPFLVIVQKGSPEFDRTHPQYAVKKIDGAQPGDIINTATREIVAKADGGVLVVPVGWQKRWVEWKPRESQGGFVQAHADPEILSTCKRNDKGQDVLPNGNLLVTTCYFPVVIADSTMDQQAIISMTSTQLKKSRAWLNIANAIKVISPKGLRVTPPLFSHVYRLGTEPESNAKGSWFGWTIKMVKMVDNLAHAEKLVEYAKQATSRQIAALPAPEDEDRI